MKVNEILDFLNESCARKTQTVQQIQFLENLQGRISPEILAVFVKFLRERAILIELQDAIDVCGTGGSLLPRINTSTVVAFILASLGVKVAKHGNRASCGRFGSFDLLDALGVEINLNNEAQKFLFQRSGLAFLFARNHHPVMMNFAEARAKIGHPTIFNVLGPLLNPAQVKMQIIGTAFADKMELMAETCLLLGMEKVMIVRGNDGLDEVSLTGPTQIVELREGKIFDYELCPEDFGVNAVNGFSAIAGGDAKNNLVVARQLLRGEGLPAHVDLVCVNAALALVMTAAAPDLKSGYLMAKNILQEENRPVFEFYQQYVSLAKTPSILLEIASHKRREVMRRAVRAPHAAIKKGLGLSERDFAGFIKMGSKPTDRFAIIAEIKKASPSNSEICKDNFFDVRKIALEYEAAGVSAISVLSDEKFFRGSLEFLRTVSQCTDKTPIFCKDFIITDYQIYEARKYGADAILLIASLLSLGDLKNFREIAESLNMDAMVEIHDDIDLDLALRSGAKIIGINRRNLHDFKIDPYLVRDLACKIPGHIIVVAESGITSILDVCALPFNVKTLLVGTSLMKSLKKKELINKLKGNSTIAKICGIRTKKIAEKCENLCIDLAGINFVPASKRVVSLKKAQKLRKSFINTKVVGIFQNQKVDEINKIAKLCNLDYIQLSGSEDVDFVRQMNRPVIKSFSVSSTQDLAMVSKYLPFVAFILFDGNSPGGGRGFDHALLRNYPLPFILAGGIDFDNFRKVLKLPGLIGVDIASGVETNGQIDEFKLLNIKKLLNSSPRGENIYRYEN